MKRTNRFLGKGVSLLCAVTLLLSLAFSVAWSVSAADGTVEFNGSTYNYEIVGSYMDLFAGSESGYTAVGSSYTRTESGWGPHDVEGTVSGTTSYLYYDFVIDGTALGVFLNGWQSGINATIAEKHGVTLVGEENNLLPAGTYRGVIDVSGLTVGTLKMALLSATVTVNELAFVNLTEVGGTTTTTTASSSGTDKTVTFNGSTYNYEIVGSYMDLFAGSESGYTAVGSSYTRTESGWGPHDVEGTVSGTTSYLYYDFVIDGTALGVFLNGWQSGINATIAEKHGVTLVGEENNLLPAGTYRGVIDVSGLTVGTLKMALLSATVTVNELAFVNLTEVGGSDTPSSSTTTTTTTTPSQPSTPSTGVAEERLYWHGDAQYLTSGTSVSLLATGTGSGVSSEEIDGTMAGIAGYKLTASGAEGTYSMPSVSATGTGDYLLFDFTVNGYVDIQINGFSELSVFAKEYGFKDTDQFSGGRTGLPDGKYTGLVEKSALSIGAENTISLKITLGANASVELRAMTFLSATQTSDIKEAYLVGGKLYTIDTVHQWILRANGAITEDGSSEREEIGSTMSGYTGALLKPNDIGHVIYNNASGGGWKYSFNGSHYLYYDFAVLDAPTSVSWCAVEGEQTTSLNALIAEQNGVTLENGKLPVGDYAGVLKLSDLGVNSFSYIAFDNQETRIEAYALAFVDATAVTDGESDAPLTADFDLLGSSIRFGQTEDNTSDIRFGTSFGLNGTLYSTLCGNDNAYAYAGDVPIEFGALVIPSAVLTGGLDLNTSNVENIVTYYIFSQDSNTLLYTSVLLDIPYVNRDTSISARGYMRFKLGDTHYVVYTKQIDRSVVGTAQNMLDSGDLEAYPEILEKVNALLGESGTASTTKPSSTSSTTTTAKPTTTTTTASSSGTDKTVTFNGATYTYEIVGSYMELFAQSSAYTKVGDAYTRAANGWDPQFITGTVSGTTSYLYYDFVVEGGNLGIYLDTWNSPIGAIIAQKHGTTQTGEDADKMGPGTYRGVIDVSGLSIGTLTMGQASATVTVNELAFVTLKDASGNAPTTTTTASGAIPPAVNDGVHLNFRNSEGTIGVWWWSSADAINASTRSSYLQFLYENQVSEIYLSASGMSNDQIATFIRAAGALGMHVAWLSGDVSWINSQNTAIVSSYIAYQNQAASDAKFYALHLDVEPHQLGADFTNNRAAVMQRYANYVQTVATMIHNAGQKIEWDIPFWMESDTVTINGSSVNILTHIAGVSDTICIMSYRDTASAILSVSAEEINAAKAQGCKIVLGVETYSLEGDEVSFMEEGKRALVSELGSVYNSLAGRGLSEYGVAVHYMAYWYSLKNG